MSKQSLTRRIALELYVAGSAQPSEEAIHNVRALIDRHPDISFDLNVIDVFEHPEQASHRRVLATPTLIKVSPSPLCRLIGDLGEPALLERVLCLADTRGTEPPGNVIFRTSMQH